MQKKILTQEQINSLLLEKELFEAGLAPTRATLIALLKENGLNILLSHLPQMEGDDEDVYATAVGHKKQGKKPYSAATRPLSRAEFDEAYAFIEILRGQGWPVKGIAKESSLSASCIYCILKKERKKVGRRAFIVLSKLAHQLGLSFKNT